MKSSKYRDERCMTTHTSLFRLIKILLVAVFVATTITIGFWTNTMAAADKFFRAEGMVGESMDSNHRNWSDLTAYTNVFKPNKSESCKVVIDKVIDSMSPTLWMNAISKIPLNDCVFTINLDARGLKKLPTLTPPKSPMKCLRS